MSLRDFTLAKSWQSMKFKNPVILSRRRRIQKNHFLFIDCHESTIAILAMTIHPCATLAQEMGTNPSAEVS